MRTYDLPTEIPPKHLHYNILYHSGFATGANIYRIKKETDYIAEYLQSVKQPFFN
jgi:hypothetical protein